jgi:RNA polymerase sigma factor (sigma-70 family)
MKNKIELNPLSPIEQDFADENYYLVNRFLRKSKLKKEECFDVVIFGYLLSVRVYLHSKELQKRCPFVSVSYMYMKRAIYKYYRGLKAKKRSFVSGKDLSYENDMVDVASKGTDIVSEYEYQELLYEIENSLTDEQQKIFYGRLDGYTLKEIARDNGMNPNRVYRQFRKIKRIVADAMEIDYE